MSRFTLWIAEMQNHVEDAIHLGCNTENEIVNYVKNNMNDAVDETFVRNVAQEYLREHETV